MIKTAITQRLAGTGGAKWEVHFKGRALAEAGADVIELSIGEPDVPPPEELLQAATDAMWQGRTKYAPGEGELGLREALAERYTKSTGRAIHRDHVLCFPGTQTSLYIVMMGVAETGCEVLVGDPMYATYEGVIRASGAEVVPVPLRPENGFRMNAEDLAAKVTDKTTAILLTTPHNPSGAILTTEDIKAIGRVAIDNDLWIVSDEVYEDFVYEAGTFSSPLAMPELADRVIVVSSISKSHAAPGFRSGWSIGPVEFNEALLALSETMLFGNQPFIADMTEKAIREGSSVVEGMRTRFEARASRLQSRLESGGALKVHKPEAGMFALIDVSSTGMTAHQYALHLLEHAQVVVMPGSSFGESLNDWVRVALTVDDERFDTACDRIVAHANGL